MSFIGWKEPTRAVIKGEVKWQIRKKAMPDMPWVMRYVMTGEQEKIFGEKFAVSTNEEMMKLFGIGASTVHRIARKLGLKKNEAVIREKQTKAAVETCKKNGVYLRLHYQRPSEKAVEATRKMRAEGFNPALELKRRDPERYSEMVRRRVEAWKANRQKEKRRLELGLQPKTKFNLPQFKYTHKQIVRRSMMLKMGYIIGDFREKFGERYTIYYDAGTRRKAKIETAAEREGFTIKELKK